MELTVVFESEVGGSSLAWEQGMWLLLNACDLEMSVQAVFLRPVKELSALPESLGKKLQQFELYEIPSYGLVAGGTDAARTECEAASSVGEAAVGAEKIFDNQLDWSWVSAVQGHKIGELLEASQQVITV